MHKQYTPFMLVASTILLATPAIYAFSWSSLSLSKPKVQQEHIHRKYSLNNKIKKLTLSTNGIITVKTDQSSDMVYFKATKQSAQKEHIALVQIKDSQTDNILNIEVLFENPDNTCLVDVELIVPECIELDLKSIDGDIRIKGSHGIITATTNGSIELFNLHNTVIASTSGRGSIKVDHAYGSLNLETDTGLIKVSNTHQSIIAKTTKGAIEIDSKELPATGTLNLHSDSGNIVVSLPLDINANLKLYTKTGFITCNHFVTLKPRTTQINKKSWRILQKDIEGTIGTGEGQVTLSSNKGCIKVIERKTV